jgi:hypothetical protein
MNEAAEINPRPEQVEPPKLEGCACAVGLFNQLRQKVARGEVLDRWYQGWLAREECTVSIDVRFELGQPWPDNTRDARAVLNKDLLRLIEALLFSGQVSVLVYEGRVVGSLLTEVSRLTRVERQ